LIILSAASYYYSKMCLRLPRLCHYYLSMLLCSLYLKFITKTRAYIVVKRNRFQLNLVVFVWSNSVPEASESFKNTPFSIEQISAKSHVDCRCLYAILPAIFEPRELFSGHQFLCHLATKSISFFITGLLKTLKSNKCVNKITMQVTMSI